MQILDFNSYTDNNHIISCMLCHDCNTFMLDGEEKEVEYITIINHSEMSFRSISFFDHHHGYE